MPHRSIGSGAAEAVSPRPAIGVRGWLADRSARARRDEGGFVIAWFALLLIALLLFVGLALDVANWWYTAQKVQRAADNAAMAGVVFLPAEQTLAYNTARTNSSQNGYTNGVNAVVTPLQMPNPNRLQVTVETEVTNFFASFAGINTTTITRRAIAEFLGPVPMGSPENKLANDPEAGYSPDYWMNMAGPNTHKRFGDRYGPRTCSTDSDRCTGSVLPGIQNDDFNQNGYSFAVAVQSVVPGQPLNIEIFDGINSFVGDFCERRVFPTPAELQALAALPEYAGLDPVNRYAGWPYNVPANAPPPGYELQRWLRPSNSIWCTGDQRLDNQDNVETTFYVLQPDSTPWTDLDNPVEPSCPPITFGSRNAREGQPDMINWLNPATWGANPQNRVFYEQFRRWFRICSIPNPVVGDYILVARTNVRANAPFTYDPSVATGGQNRFSIRVGFGAGVEQTNSVVGQDNVRLYAKGRLPIYVNAANANTNFFLARIQPSGGATRSLRVALWDISDYPTSGTGTWQMVDASGVPFSGCVFRRADGAVITQDVNSATCRISSPQGRYDRRLVFVDVPIAADYDCDITNPFDCWVRMDSTLPVANDSTTWSADILGDPVRLIE